VNRVQGGQTEYGKATLFVDDETDLFKGIARSMSAGDKLGDKLDDKLNDQGSKPETSNRATCNDCLDEPWRSDHQTAVRFYTDCAHGQFTRCGDEESGPYRLYGLLDAKVTRTRTVRFFIAATGELSVCAIGIKPDGGLMI